MSTEYASKIDTPSVKRDPRVRGVVRRHRRVVQDQKSDAPSPQVGWVQWTLCRPRGAESRSAGHLRKGGGPQGGFLVMYSEVPCRPTAC
jgi:hypothetical protein